MSISAPEAHSPVSHDRLDRGAEDYAHMDADRDDKVAPGMVEIHETRRAPEPARGMRLARTALVTSMAGELIRHSRDQDTTPDSRRLAIQLATTALSRHHASVDRQRLIARRYQ